MLKPFCDCCQKEITNGEKGAKYVRVVSMMTADMKPQFGQQADDLCEACQIKLSDFYDKIKNNE